MKLMEKPNEYEQFIQWSALPTTERDPATQKELALKLNVAEPTLSDWKKREDYYPRLRECIRIWAKDRTANVVQGLYQRARKTGDPSAAKLWLQAFDEFVEEQKVSLSPQDRLLEAYGLKKDGKLADDVVADIKRLEGEYGKDDDDAEAASQKQT